MENRRWRRFETTGKYHLVNPDSTKWHETACGLPVREDRLGDPRTAFETVEYRPVPQADVCKSCKRSELADA